MPHRIVDPAGARGTQGRLAALAAVCCLPAFVALAVFALSAPGPTSFATPPPSTTHSTANTQAFGSIPLTFAKNEGQADARADYLYQGDGYALFVNSHEMVWNFKGAAATRERRLPGPTMPDSAGRYMFWTDTLVSDIQLEPSLRISTLSLSLLGADVTASAKPERLQRGRNNYFVGQDRSKWRTDVPNYARIRYENVYPGVDLVYYGNDRQLEYDFIVEPGANPSAIRLGFEGASAAHLNASGDLVLDVGGREIVQPRPVVYQEREGTKTPVVGAYALKKPALDSASFEVALTLGSYDRNRALVIDPVLLYSTYVSGDGADEIRSIDVDGDGNLHVFGMTSSMNFPALLGGLPPEQGGQQSPGTTDLFIMKLNAAGDTILYSTYLSGNGDDLGFAMKVDGAGAVYVTGTTGSTNFPVVGGLPAAQAGSPDGQHSPFVAKLNPQGNALEYSTYLGAGGGADEAYALAIDSNGSAYVTGFSQPPYNFPLVGGLAAAQGGAPAGEGSIFVAKINPSGDGLAYSTYLAGSGFEWGTTLAVDSAGQAYVGGYTTSLNMPRVGGLGIDEGGVASQFGTAFFAKLNAQGNALVYSTYFGGSDQSTTFGDVLTVDSAGDLFIGGRTSSSQIPIVGGLPPEQGGGGRGDACCADIYVAKLNPEGNALLYSTYLAGNFIDGVYGLIVDDVGNLYMAGQTNSTNFPQKSGLPVEQGGTPPVDTGGPFGPSPCGFVSKLNAAGDNLVFSTYFCANNTAWALARSPAGDVYVAGNAGTAELQPFPILGGLPAGQGGTPLGGLEAYIAKLNENAELISIDRAQYSVSESAGSIDVVVTRSGVSPAAASVQFATVAGTATAGSDYQESSGTLIWSAGDMTPRTITVPIASDDVVEGDETFTLTLSNSLGAAMGSPATATVHIVDEPLPDPIYADGFEGAP
jgi:hypothetical protein